MDGYYRVPLSPDVALALAVVIPSDIAPVSSNLIAIPLALPMGWTHSPLFFCAYTETITDLTNNPVNIPTTHPLLHETQCLTLPQHNDFHEQAIFLGDPHTPHLGYTDIYIDDFMVLAQRPLHMSTMTHLLTNIDSVFLDQHPTNRHQIVSASKLQ